MTTVVGTNKGVVFSGPSGIVKLAVNCCHLVFKMYCFCGVFRCAELLVMKAELELMQGEREESALDLEKVRTLLEICTGLLNTHFHLFNVASLVKMFNNTEMHYCFIVCLI